MWAGALAGGDFYTEYGTIVPQELMNPENWLVMDAMILIKQEINFTVNALVSMPFSQNIGSFKGTIVKIYD